MGDSEEKTTGAVDPAVRRWVHRLKRGETLFAEGEEGSGLYILMDGRVEVLRRGVCVAEINVSDTFIGEMSALTGQPRTATVMATADSTFLYLRDMDELAKVEPSLGVKLARTLAKRLERMNDRLAALQTQLNTVDDTDCAAGDARVLLLGSVAESMRAAAENDSSVII
jgi:CRP-like cAMP-binding protein